MSKFPAQLETAINEFTNLPGVGRKTAERYVFYLMKQPAEVIEKLITAISQLHNQISQCPRCGNFSTNKNLCAICADPNRDSKIICVVEESHDLIVIESTGEYHGLYHVLHGTLNPLEGITEKQLNINSLIKRVKTEKTSEIIIALNPDLTGEATTIYLKKLLIGTNVKITRLARGLPMGADLEYADEVTLSNAIKWRKEA